MIFLGVCFSNMFIGFMENWIFSKTTSFFLGTMMNFELNHSCWRTKTSYHHHITSNSNAAKLDLSSLAAETFTIPPCLPEHQGIKDGSQTPLSSEWFELGIHIVTGVTFCHFCQFSSGKRRKPEMANPNKRNMKWKLLSSDNPTQTISTHPASRMMFRAKEHMHSAASVCFLTFVSLR